MFFKKVDERGWANQKQSMNKEEIERMSKLRKEIMSIMNDTPEQFAMGSQNLDANITVLKDIRRDLVGAKKQEKEKKQNQEQKRPKRKESRSRKEMDDMPDL